MTVGSKEQNIPFYLYLQQYPIVLQPSNAQKGEVKGIYNPLDSTSYKKIEEEKQFDKGDLQKGILSEDKFKFNSTSSNIVFYLSIENYGYSHITEGGKLGFGYSNEYGESIESSFVKKLKSLDMISSYDISILYDSNKTDEDTGNLLIGALPHKVNNKTYNESDLKNALSNSYGQWEIIFEKISLGNNTFDRSKEAYFYPEFGFIVGTFNFFDALNQSANWYELFNSNKKCHNYKFQIDDIEASDIPTFLFEYTGYYCEKDVNVDDIINQSLIFSSQKFVYEFILNNKDLWIEKNGYKYFMVLRTLNIDNCWIFGKPFFKRFHMSFNIDSKIMNVYPNVNFDVKDDKKPNKENDYTVLYIGIIVGLVLISGILAFFLIKQYISAPRKKRANELLDDNFEYTETEKTENQIMPSEGDK